MEVGPQGAASPPPTSSALVAAPLATENKVEIGNATACAEVVASLVAQLRAAGGLAAFGDMEKLETALAARDREHVLGQLLPLRQHQSIVSVDARTRGIVVRDDGRNIDARERALEDQALPCSCRALPRRDRLVRGHD